MGRYKPSRKLLQQPKWRKEFNILSQNVSLTNYVRKTETFLRGKKSSVSIFYISLPTITLFDKFVSTVCILSMFYFYASFLISIRIISWHFLCLVKSFVGCYENMFTCFFIELYSTLFLITLDKDEIDICT